MIWFAIGWLVCFAFSSNYAGARRLGTTGNEKAPNLAVRPAGAAP
jgi:hypothetical protein